MKEVKLGILGLGTVGGGVVNVLAKNKDIIKAKTGVDIAVIIAAVKDKTSHRICSDNDFGILTDNAIEVVNSNADIILELIGGTTLARDLVIQALNNGKHVVTANKALIATYGNELLALAKQNGVKLLFEAAVAGGIPVLKALEQGLSANAIDSIAGIINGTGNFILTEMRDKGRAFADVLKEAQDLGYAEADPTFDVEGNDAGHKLAILTSMAYGTDLSYDKVLLSGISQVESLDTKLSDELGFKIKHLAVAKKVGDKVQMSVKPTLIPQEKLLANVDGVMNAVMITGNAVGETMFYGAGAGSDATASSVVADVIDIINNTSADNVLGWQELKAAEILDNDEALSEAYLRLLVADDKGVLANISQILANFDISIENMVQHPEGDNARIAIITSSVSGKKLKLACDELNQQEFSKEEVHMLNVETFNN
jgi:homoserine dehydrogenase